MENLSLFFLFFLDGGKEKLLGDLNARRRRSSKSGWSLESHHDISFKKGKNGFFSSLSPFQTLSSFPFSLTDDEQVSLSNHS